MNNDKPARLAHRGLDGLKIQRTEAARVYNLNRDAFSGQLFSGLQGDVLEFMAVKFPELRQALNDLVDRHLELAPKPAAVATLCRQALYRVRN